MLPQGTSISQRDSQPNASGKPGAVHLQLARRIEIRIFLDLRKELDSVRDAAAGGEIVRLRKLPSSPSACARDDHALDLPRPQLC